MIDSSLTLFLQQECIPVGCVPSAAVAPSGKGVSGRGVSVFMDQEAGEEEGVCLGVSAFMDPKVDPLDPGADIPRQTPSPCEQNDSQTGVKTLPFRNCCCER